jgi:hypothetical protein
MSTLTGRFQQALSNTGRVARQTGDEFLGRLRSFNARDHLRESAAAGMDELGEDFQQLEGARRVGLNRRGLGGSNFGGAQAMRDLNERVARMLGGLSMQAGQMDQANTQAMGEFGMAQQGRFLDLLSGERDRETAEANARRQSRSSLFGSLARLGGGLAGSLLGPAGGVIGQKLAGAVASRLGG